MELMGDWKIRDGNRPTLSAYKLEFSQEELNKNWEWFKNRKLLYETVLETSELLPKILALPPGGSYECSWCHYKDQCKGEE